MKMYPVMQPFKIPVTMPAGVKDKIFMKPTAVEIAKTITIGRT